MKNPSSRSNISLVILLAQVLNLTAHAAQPGAEREPRRVEPKAGEVVNFSLLDYRGKYYELLCTGGHDNSAKNPNNPDPAKRIRWGLQSWDEMFMGFMTVADASPEPVAKQAGN